MGGISGFSEAAEASRHLWAVGRLLSAVIATLLLALVACRSPGPAWKEAELATLRSLWIGSLPPLAADPSNRFGDNPQAAVFGQFLFYDIRFSLKGDIACHFCHRPEIGFQDGLPLAQGPQTTTNRRTPSVVGAAYNTWYFWDGRADSLWAQALGPLENPIEQGGDRTYYAHLVSQFYRDEYESLFGPLPDLSDSGRFPRHAGPLAADPSARAAWETMAPADQEVINQVFANLGKAIAAYERLLRPGISRFDQYAQAVLRGDEAGAGDWFTDDEVAGLRLFIGRAGCLQCHPGPLLTDHSFHNTGTPAAVGLPVDDGRATGAASFLADPFNCRGPYSDASPGDCGHLDQVGPGSAALAGRFKTPSLRNVARRAPYMHAGQLPTLEAVLAHYNSAPAAPVGQSEVRPLNLTSQEIAQLVAFLRTLDSPVAAESQWLSPPVFTNWSGAGMGGD
ncbi:MAG: cytochrome c peroxidase [Chloroflexota bacterium]